MDLQTTAADSRGLTGSDPAIAALGDEVHQQFHHQRDVLGDTGYQQEQEYRACSAVRTLVGQFAGAIAFTTPLTAQQGEEMTQLLASASPNTDDEANWSTIDWQQVVGCPRHPLDSQFATLSGRKSRV